MVLKSFLIPKPETLSDISKDAGQVFLASVIVQPLLDNVESGGIIMAGVALTLICWTASLYLGKQ